jgi:ABC-type methionine transport system ATPase subunit
MPEIQLRAVTVERTAPGGDVRSLLDEVDLCLSADFVGSLIGPSGSGKTTALRLMNRLLDPTRGEILCDGRPLAEHPSGLLRRRVAMVFDVAHLLGRTVEENLRLVEPDADGSRCAECLRMAGLSEGFLPRRESELSAGERHRVALARALMGEPETLLLDEVTSSLDPSTALAIIKTLRGLREQRGLAILLASHVFDHVRALGGHCAVLIDGRLCEEGPAEDVFRAPREEATRDYLAGRCGGAENG